MKTDLMWVKVWVENYDVALLAGKTLKQCIHSPAQRLCVSWLCCYATDIPRNNLSKLLLESCSTELSKKISALNRSISTGFYLCHFFFVVSFKAPSIIPNLNIRPLVGTIKWCNKHDRVNQVIWVNQCLLLLDLAENSKTILNNSALTRIRL